MAGDRVYAGCEDRRVYCADAATGALVWKTETGGKVYSRPLVVGEVVLVGSYDGHLYCLDAETGAVRARVDTGGEVFSSPAIGTTRVYLGNNAGSFLGVEFRRKRAS
jgi:outer membrane protein assembly factor BamB